MSHQDLKRNKISVIKERAKKSWPSCHLKNRAQTIYTKMNLKKYNQKSKLILSVSPQNHLCILNRSSQSQVFTFHSLV